MTLKCVFLVYLCQVAIGWIPHTSTYCQMRVGSYCYVPSCQAPKIVASRGLGRAMFIRCGEPLGTFDRGPVSLPQVVKRGGRGRQVLQSRLIVLIIRWRSDGVDCSQISFFSLVTPPLRPGVMWLFPNTGCMISQSFAARVNRSYSEFWVITGSSRYPGYITLTPIIRQCDRFLT
jgi:hypothetical protein